MQAKKRKKRMRLPNGIGSVHQINDGKRRRNPWRARVQVGVNFNEATGKASPKYMTIGYYENEKDAIAALFEYRKDPYSLEAGTATFADVYGYWKEKKFEGLSASAVRNYVGFFKNSAPLHNRKMKDIRTADMEQLLDALQCKAETLTKHRMFWKQLFEYAIEHDICAKNYAEYVKISAAAPPAEGRTAIPPEHREALWQAIDAGDQDAELAMIYIYTGFRASELLEVSKEAVDLENRIIIGGLKTRAGIDRHVPIHKAILPFIQRRMEAPGDHLVMRQGKKGYSPMTYNHLAKIVWPSLMKRMGDWPYTLHYCRHTCATMLREANVEEDLRKLILGHKSQDITDHYTHLPDVMLVSAMDKVPGRQ